MRGVGDERHRDRMSLRPSHRFRGADATCRDEWVRVVLEGRGGEVGCGLVGGGGCGRLRHGARGAKGETNSFYLV